MWGAQEKSGGAHQKIFDFNYKTASMTKAELLIFQLWTPHFSLGLNILV